MVVPGVILRADCPPPQVYLPHHARHLALNRIVEPGEPVPRASTPALQIVCAIAPLAHRSTAATNRHSRDYWLSLTKVVPYRY